MGLLIRILLLVAAIYIIVRLVAGSGSRRLRLPTWSTGSRGSRFPCGSCKHCKNAFDDGVICAFAGRETFKNEVHIANCHSFERRGVG